MLKDCTESPKQIRQVRVHRAALKVSVMCDILLAPGWYGHPGSDFTFRSNEVSSVDESIMVLGIAVGFDLTKS